MTIIGLYTSRVVLQVLGVSDYGVYNAVGGAVTMLSILSASLSTAISRYLTFELGKGDAMSLINELRDRAGIEPLKSVALDKIKHERKVELAFENHRYWDLRRWRDAETALTRSFTGIRYVYDWASKEFLIEFIPNIDGQNQPTFPERCYYFPITLARISANPSLVENPGY